MKPQLETDFAPESRVGLLWGDVKSHYLKRHCPDGAEPQKCLAQLENDVHVGYNSTDHGWFKKIFHQDVLFSGEVAEYAYRFKEYYPYLAKHKFPLPFVADDEGVRKELFAAVDSIRAKLVQEGLIQQSQEFQLAMIKEISEWGKKNLSFEKDCAVESGAGDAFKNKCGDDTEKSAILYVMFEHAGLPAGFVKVIGQEPTPQEFQRVLNEHIDERDSGKICVGVKVIGQDKLFLLDPADGRFDPHYGDIEEYSLYEYVKDAWFSKRIWSLQAGRQYDALANEAQFAIEMSPENFTFHQVLLTAYIKLNRMAAASDLDKITNKKFGKNILASPYFLFGKIIGGMREEAEKLEAVIGELGKVEPKAAALAAERLAYNMLMLSQNSSSFSINTQKFLSELALKTLKIGMEHSERYLNNFAGFIEVCEYLEKYKEAADFFKGYSVKRPDSAFGHYLAARALLHLASFTQFKDIPPLVQDAQMHLIEMCRLADCNSESYRDQLLEARSSLLLYSGKSNEAISMLEEKYKKEPSEFGQNLCQALFFSYAVSGRFSEAKSFIVDSIKDGGKKSRDFWLDFIYGQLSTLEFDNKNSASKSGVIKISSAELLKGIIDVFSAAADVIGEDENFKEERSVIYILLSVHALQGGDAKKASDFFSAVEEPVSDMAEAALQVLLNSGLLPISNMPAMDLKKALKFTASAEEMYKGIADNEISSLYLMIARQFIKSGDIKRAENLIKTAFGIGGKYAYNFYFENAAKALSLEAFEDKANGPKVSAALTALEICVETEPHCPMRILRDIRKGLAGFEGIKDAGRIKKLGEKIDKIILEDK